MRFEMREWKIGYNIDGDAAGCFGCSAASTAGDGVWRIAPRGIVLCGGYDELLHEAEALAGEGFVPDAVVAFFAYNRGIEKTLAALGRLFPGVPFCGGGAAPAPDGEPKLYPAGGEVSVLFIKDERYSFSHRFRDLPDVSRPLLLEGPDSRTVTFVTDGERLPAPEWLDMLKDAHGFRAGSFENVTLVTADGYNLHLSGGDGVLNTGSDIPASGEVSLGFVSDAEAQERVNAFLTDPSELVFGCAGLRSMTTDVTAAGACGFLHGEILTSNGAPHFANLMMSALSAVAR